MSDLLQFFVKLDHQLSGAMPKRLNSLPLFSLQLHFDRKISARAKSAVGQEGNWIPKGYMKFLLFPKWDTVGTHGSCQTLVYVTFNYTYFHRTYYCLLLGPDEALLIALKIAGTSCEAKPDLLGCKLGGECIFIVFPSNCIPDSVRSPERSKT